MVPCNAFSCGSGSGFGFGSGSGFGSGFGSVGAALAARRFETRAAKAAPTSPLRRPYEDLAEPASLTEQMTSGRPF
jgi:hypothetical protein